MEIMTKQRTSNGTALLTKVVGADEIPCDIAELIDRLIASGSSALSLLQDDLSPQLRQLQGEGRRGRGSADETDDDDADADER